MRLKTPFVTVIWENPQYGSIVWKQDKKFGRHFGVDFTNPDFVKLAESFGLPAWRCESVDGLPAATCAQALDARRAVADRAADRLLARRGDLARNSERRRSRHESASRRAEGRRRGPEAALHRRRVARRRRSGTLAGRGSRHARDALRGRRRDSATTRSRRSPRRRRPRPSGQRTRRASAARSCAARSSEITERADDLALLMTLEMGKALAESKAEITYAAEFFRWFAEEAVRIEGRYAVAPNGAGPPADDAAAGRPVRADHAVELPDGDGHAQDRPGGRRRLHDGGQAREADAAVDARAGRDPRGGAGCRAAC